MRKSRAGIAFAALLMTVVMPAKAATASESTAATVCGSLLTELNDYLKDYRTAEHISAVSLAVTFRGSHPGINLAAGSTRFSGGSPVSPYALWQIGSNTKAFTSVLVLQLEAEHRLSINDTLGKWLPQYAAWSHVTIKQLLDMTSGIPNYTDSAEYWQDVAAAPHGAFSASRLVSYALSQAPTQGYSYSNTNYILLQMIIERAAHDGYSSQLRHRIIAPLNLRNVFYSATNYPPAITDRLPAGYWHIPLPGMKSQYGRSQSRHTLSWAQGAGGIIGSLQDLAAWDRTVFGGRELPGQQQRELTSLVSTQTGKPIKKTTLADPAGYGLGVSQVTSKALGTVWYYEGETDGFRVVNLFAPRSGTAIVIGVNSASLTDHTATLATSIFQTLRNAGLA
jgi:D-alanyl-D-alanine carboxypeptidase